MFERHGIDISRKTMGGWMAQCTERLDTVPPERPLPRSLDGAFNSRAGTATPDPSGLPG
jgi:hypothetical protein